MSAGAIRFRRHDSLIPRCSVIWTTGAIFPRELNSGGTPAGAVQAYKTPPSATSVAKGDRYPEKRKPSSSVAKRDAFGEAVLGQGVVGGQQDGGF